MPSQQAKPTIQRPVLATGDDYRATFQGFKPGQKVLEDLCARFHDRRTYVQGGLEGQRETERRAAQKDVVTFILARLGQIDDQGEDDAT